MQTPPGPPSLGHTPPHQQPSSILPNISWMSEQIAFSRLMSDSQTAPVAITNAATPRRYSPPSPGASDLAEFFGSPQKEWCGVKIERLASNVTTNEVKTMFLFSVGFEDLRVVRNDQALRGPYSAEAYVRLQNKGYAEEAERLLNNKDFNGTNIAVTVVPRPTSSEIVRMAASTEMFASDFSSQSPSSSDGLTTPATIGTLPLSEYTTATSRHIASPIGNVHTTTNGMIGRSDAGLGNDIFPIGMNGAGRNGTATSEADMYPAMAALDRLNINNDQMNGIGSINGYDNSYSTEGYMDSMSSLLPSRGMGLFHQTLDQSPEHDVAVGDGYGDSLSSFSRPRRQTNPAQPNTGTGSRFGNLPPLSTVGVNGYSQAGITSPLTAPPVAAPGLTSPMSLNSPNGWPSSAVNKPYYSNFPISHPPANPADQNPPCNTLYVGNLPAQTSEDELKAMFCRQRGYKRMCFRTKPQGPMCFVEFEDTHYATKALTELYGRALSNSTKGGVRLSFSKNPLGVRSQPSNGPSPPSVPKGSNSIPGPTGVPSHSFSATPLRTPPGLPAPTRQMSSLPTPTANEPSGPPPGLFGSNNSSQQLREQPNAFGRSSVLGNSQPTSRLPPGIPPTGSFYSGTTPDIRSPMDIRSPVGDIRPPGPGAIGTR